MGSGCTVKKVEAITDWKRISEAITIGPNRASRRKLPCLTVVVKPPRWEADRLPCWSNAVAPVSNLFTPKKKASMPTH